MKIHKMKNLMKKGKLIEEYEIYYQASFATYPLIFS